MYLAPSIECVPQFNKPSLTLNSALMGSPIAPDSITSFALVHPGVNRRWCETTSFTLFFSQASTIDLALEVPIAIGFSQMIPFTKGEFAA